MYTAMPRNRRRKKPAWATVPVWGALALLAGWSIWQAREFQHSLLADVRQSEARSAAADLPRDALSRSQQAVKAAREIDDPLTPVLMQPGPEPFPEATIDFVDPLLSVSPEEAAAQTAPAVDPALSANELVQLARKLMDAGRIVDGRAALNAALARTSDQQQADRLRTALTSLNTGVFLGSALLPEDPLARYVDIQPGDSFLRLARKYTVTAAYLQSINPSLNPRNLKPLMGVKVVPGPFSATLVKHASRLDLFVRDMYLRSFPILLPEGNYLPPGDYRIAPGTKLQAGAHSWIGFDGAEPATQNVTRGWIFGPKGPRGNALRDRTTGLQMTDSDLQQLYNVLVESHSHLHVIP
jgi:hypothetical protein